MILFFFIVVLLRQKSGLLIVFGLVLLGIVSYLISNIYGGVDSIYELDDATIFKMDYILYIGYSS